MENLAAVLIMTEKRFCREKQLTSTRTVKCRFADRFREPLPGPDPWCLTCPPWDFIELSVFGGMVEGVEPIVEQNRKVHLSGKPAKQVISTEAVEKAGLSGAKQSLDYMQREIKVSIEESK